MAKSIQGSVGNTGTNHSQDVTTIQYLLNCVPESKGGPYPELAVDGILGPKTTAAILKFQKAMFNWTDGRVDPNGKTLNALHQFDPYPNMPIVGGAGEKKGGYKSPMDPTGKAVDTTDGIKVFDSGPKPGYADYKIGDFKTATKNLGGKWF